MATDSLLLVSAGAPTITLSATTSNPTAVDLPAVGETVRIVNEGPNNAYVSIASGTAPIATVPPAAGSSGLLTSMAVLANTVECFRIPDNKQCQISAITVAGTATLRVQVSHGA